MSGSVSFERAAGYYDQTRALPPEVMAEVIKMLVSETSGRGRCLEVGVGTGRFALPLARLGVHVVGIDVSMAMLRRLRENSEGAPLPTVVADATRLPFPDRTFKFAIAAHVLHLVPTWPEAVSELLRVLVPEGRLLATRGGRTSGSWEDRVRRQFFIEAGDHHWPPGLDRIEGLDQVMRAKGAVVKELPAVAHGATSSVAEVLAGLEAGLFSPCWDLDDDTRRRAAAATRTWADRNIGDAAELRSVTRSSVWHAYDLANR